MNCAFSLGVFAGKASRNRIVETRMLSKYLACWKSRAFNRSAGLLVMSFGSTSEVMSFGSGLEDKKLLLCEGREDDDAKSRLYVEALPFVSSGLL